MQLLRSLHNPMKYQVHFSIPHFTGLYSPVQCYAASLVISKVACVGAYAFTSTGRFVRGPKAGVTNQRLLCQQTVRKTSSHDMSTYPTYISANPVMKS